MNSLNSPSQSFLALSKPVLMVCVIASLGGLLYGFDMAVISGTQAMVEQQFDLTKMQVGWFVSSAIVGCIVGALVSGLISDFGGRKLALILLGIFFFVSAVMTTLAWNYPSLIVARLIGGFGVGIASGQIPTYVSEFSPYRLRGRLALCYQLSIVTGILLSYFSNWMVMNHSLTSIVEISPDKISLFEKIFVTECWRGMFGMETIPALGFVCLLFFLVESPRWLISVGKEEKAMQIMVRAFGHEEAELQKNEIKQLQSHESGGIWELFRPGFRTAMLVAVGIAVLGQLTGVNLVIYYGPDIMREAGIPDTGALFFQVIIGLVNLVFTLIALKMIDSAGRRPLLIWGMAAASLFLSLGVLMLFFNAPAIMIVLVLAAFIAAVAISVCAVIWVLIPEILPNRIRGRAVSIATFSGWVTVAISSQFFPVYIETCGLIAGFATCAGFCIFSTFFFYRLVPETKGKTLEEIESNWLKLKGN